MNNLDDLNKRDKIVTTVLVATLSLFWAAIVVDTIYPNLFPVSNDASKIQDINGVPYVELKGAREMLNNPQSTTIFNADQGNSSKGFKFKAASAPNTNPGGYGGAEEQMNKDNPIKSKRKSRLNSILETVRDYKGPGNQFKKIANSISGDYDYVDPYVINEPDPDLTGIKASQERDLFPLVNDNELNYSEYNTLKIDLIFIFYILTVGVFLFLLFRTKINNWINKFTTKQGKLLKNKTLKLKNWKEKLTIQQRFILSIIVPIVIFFISFPIMTKISGREGIWYFERTWLVWLIYISMIGLIEYQFWGRNKTK
jgi:hypothetical protein